MTCSQPDCSEPIKARGMCSRHYQHFRWHGCLDEVAPTDVKVCITCGSPVIGRRWRAVYCSRACNDRHAYQVRTAEVPPRSAHCEQCSVRIAGKRKDARFCSVRCGQDWRNSRLARERRETKAVGPGCQACDKPLGPNRRRFCSDECKFDDRRARVYGLTVRDLHALMESQGRACAICRTQEWGAKGPQVDHCHVDFRVRGVLCASCNNGLGRFKDDPDRLRRAAAYLEAPLKE